LRRLPLFGNLSNEEALKKMKELLHDTESVEDISLLKELNEYEKNRSFLTKGGFIPPSRTSKLAIKNLSKVYGRS
jgi:hypothetical protein